MAVHTIKNGLRLIVAGEPEQKISAATPVSHVGLVAADYPGLNAELRVSVGDTVKRGQPIFNDAARPSVQHTASGAGTVAAIERGANGEFVSVSIALSPSERAGTPSDAEQQSFTHYLARPIPGLSRDQVRALLLESGLWTAFRTRPFGRVPDAAQVPDGIFISAMDTEPLAPKAEVVIAQNAEAFEAGITVIAKLREGYMYLCVAKGSPVKAGPYSGITTEQFDGLHPTGTPGAQIHFLLKVTEKKRTVWHIGYQDVIRIGTLFTTGKLSVDTVVALAGPAMKSPRLVRTRLGAALGELTANESLAPGAHVQSGGPFTGSSARSDVEAYLGRYHRIVAARSQSGAQPGREWLAAGASNPANSLLRAYRTSAFGMRPASLLRALKSGDVARADALGVRGVDEEDVAFMAFGQSGQQEYTAQLRRILMQLESQG